MSEPDTHNPYADARLYAEQQADFTEDLPFWLELAREARGPVLELGSGTGRVAHYLAREGIEVAGMDLDPAMVAYARAEADRLGLAKASFVEADWCTFALGRRFPLIILPFNSICHLTDPASFLAAMARIQAHLEPGGLFVPSIFMPLGRFFDRDPEAMQSVAHFWSESRQEDMEVFESARYNPLSQINEVRWFYSGDNDESEVKEVHYRLRIYQPQELAMLLEQAGFTLEGICGDWTRKAADASSLSLSYLARWRQG